MLWRNWRPTARVLALCIAGTATPALAQQSAPLPPTGPIVQSGYQDQANSARLPSVQPVSAARVMELEARLEELEKKAADDKKKDDDKKKGYEVGSDLGMTAKWKNGVEIETKNKDFRFHVGGRTQIDGVWLSQDGANDLNGPFVGAGNPNNGLNGVMSQDSVNFRRARLRADGTMYEFIDWAAEYDFQNYFTTASPTTEGNDYSVTAPTDLWFDIKSIPYINHFRVGNMKEPIGFEHSESSRYLDFMERSFLQDAFTGPFNNGFTPGMMAYDEYGEGSGTWAAGVFKNTQNAFAYGVGDGEYAATGRVTYLPWYDEPSKGRYLTHVGISGSYRNNDQDRLRIRSRGSLRNGPGNLNPTYVDTGNFTSDNQGIAGVEFVQNYGPLLLQAEWMGSWATNGFANATTSFPAPAGTPLGTVFVHGYYVEAMYFLTGEHREYEKLRGCFTRVVPHENFYWVDTKDCGRCLSRGAWQLGVRYDYLDLQDGNIDGGRVQDFTLGLNWFLNPNMKVQWNYVYTHRDAPNGTSSVVGAAGVPTNGIDGNTNGFGMRVAHDF